jgi:hypothetical protein
MTSYIRRAFPAKRIDILQKEERELLHAIKSDSNTEKLVRTAEKVRQAQLKFLKGKKHYVVDDGNSNFEGFKKIDIEIAEWSSKTVEEIIEKYKRASQVHNSSDSI